MRVLVQRSDDGVGRATVLEPTDLTSLQVELDRVDEAAAARALAEAGLGVVREGYAWLDVEALRAAALAGASADAAPGFDAMVAYARSRGWTSDDGRRVRAHCEHVGGAGEPVGGAGP